MRTLALFVFFVAIIAIASAQSSALSSIVNALTGPQSWSQMLINLIQKVINALSNLDRKLFNFQIRQG